MLQPHKPMNEATMEYKHPIGNIIRVLFTIYTHTHAHMHWVAGTIEHRTFSSYSIWAERYGENRAKEKMWLISPPQVICWKCIVVVFASVPLSVGRRSTADFSFSYICSLRGVCFTIHSDKLRISSSLWFGQAAQLHRQFVRSFVRSLFTSHDTGSQLKINTTHS